jgi:NAD(P)-dependent dehydrogenase (short-subunit alcohol dehydrogenase family)
MVAASAAHRSIRNQHVLVTGAARGIGLQLVQELLSRGNTVVATVRNTGTASDLTALQSSDNPELTGRLHIVEMDVSSAASIKKAVAELKASYSHFEVVINNAGILGEPQSFDELTGEDLISVFQTNTVGPVLLTQQLKLQGLIGEQETLVINVSSLIGSTSFDLFDHLTVYQYRASKAALNMLTRFMDLALAKDNITVMAVSPGYVKTAMSNYEGEITTEESAQGILAVAENGQDLHGTFYNYTGEQLAW